LVNRSDELNAAYTDKWYSTLAGHLKRYLAKMREKKTWRGSILDKVLGFQLRWTKQGIMPSRWLSIRLKVERNQLRMLFNDFPQIKIETPLVQCQPGNEKRRLE
jgi:hypothetical protein